MKVSDIIRQLNTSDEQSNLEVKRGSQIDKSVMETICAFSNEPDLGVGYIVLGVSESDNSLFQGYDVVGIDNPDKLQKDLATQCADSFNIPVRPRISIEEVNSKNVMLIEVMELPSQQKPLYLKKQGLPQGAFRRIGSTDQRCTEDDLFLFYGTEDGFESSIVKDASMEDISIEALELYREFRKKANSAAEELSYTDEELLQALNCIKKDEGIWKPTYAGLIVFGKRMSLRRLMPMMRIDYIRLPGKNWVENPDERFSTTLDMRGPIIELVSRIISTITDDLPKGFILQEGNIQAESKSMLPVKVLREAIVNALIHRTYRVNQPIQILRYSNRIEIINAGYSLKPEDNIGEPGSINRNPSIAAIFHDTNLAETKGSGFRTMQTLMLSSNMMPPTFESNREKNNFTIRLLFHNFLNNEDVGWLENFQTYQLNDKQKLTLVFIKEIGAIDNNAFRQLTGANRTEAGIDLRDLREKELIEQKNAGKSTYYLPSPIFQDTMVDKTTTMVDKTTTMVDKTTTMVDNEPLFINDILKEIPEELLLQINKLGKRSPNPDLIKKIILELCNWRELSIAELSLILGRNEKYVKTNYIQPLIDEKKISYTIPAMITHPYQKYKTINYNYGKKTNLSLPGSHERQ